MMIYDELKQGQINSFDGKIFYSEILYEIKITQELRLRSIQT